MRNQLNKPKLLTDEVIRKRLKKITKKLGRDAKRKARRQELTGESFDLYLPEMAEGYEHLRVEIRTAFDGTHSARKGERARLVGEIENLLNVLGNDAHRVQQAFATAQDLGKKAGLTTSELPTDAKITIEPLKKRFEVLEGRANS